VKIRKPWLLKLIGLLAFWLIRLWMSTVYYRIVQLDDEPHPINARRRRCIYVLWHESLLFPTRFRVKIHVLISHHADGELIAQICRHLGFKTVRGSSSRGGLEALRKLVKLAKTTHLMVTPDGPRGPRQKVQPGLIFLAAQTGLPIVPVGVGYRHAWRLRSWDRFAVPRPWTKAVAVAGPFFHVPAKLRRVDLEYYRARVEEQLLEASEAAEQLAAGAKNVVLPGSRTTGHRVSA
jgi:lysophospholipid acyltransferase (LPLAT)-like uncharacterized protein